MADDQDIVLGIDLGTTFSAMAYVNRYGKPEIVPNAEGKPTTPSVVHFYEEDACVVGDEAMKMVVVDPENVVRFIKRHMGEEHFVLDFHGKEYTPQEISALILRKLKEDAEEILGVEVTDAVVTVPAYFNSAQRGATAEAGEIAGLNVLSILNEPTAAAIAYGLDRVGADMKVVVFDLGGGTFDVTVMHIQDTKLTTLASDGHAELGGKDWDDRIVNFVAEEFFGEFGEDPRDDPIAYQELYERSVFAKIALSSKDRAVIPVNYKGHRTVVKLEREQFEALVADLVKQCEDTTNIALEKAGLAWADLDDVILVGGSTRMPMIRSLLERLWGKIPNTTLNPDECVCLGACTAGVLRHRPDHPGIRAVPTYRRPNPQPLPPPPGPSPVAPSASPLDAPAPRGAVIGLADGGHVAEAGVGLHRVDIQDATTHPLGIVVLDQDRNERVVELIAEGTPLPHTFRGRFAYAYDNMTAVRVEVTEGVGTRRDEVTVIGKVELTGLPPRPKGTPIEVLYRYGVDQILRVQVIDVESGRSREADIRFQGGMSRDELDGARRRNRAMAVD